MTLRHETPGRAADAELGTRRMTMRITTFVTATAVALLSAMTLAQNVTHDFDRAANFKGFKTYAWVPGTRVTDDLNHARIVRAVDAQLMVKGLTRVGAIENADVLVAYHATFDKDLEINGFSSGWGPYRFGGTRSARAHVDEILVGTIAVDIVDAATRTIVWRGTASKDVDVKASPEKRERNIKRAAEKLFKNYPPLS
jgi:hypothetical protein